MSLRLARGTNEYLGTVAPAPRRSLREALRKLEADPRHPGLDIKRLRSEGVAGYYRARVGDYRVIYSIRGRDTFVWKIMHRSEGYDWLDRLDPWE